MIYFRGQLPNAPHNTVPWKVLAVIAIAFLAVTQIVQQFDKD